MSPRADFCWLAYVVACAWSGAFSPATVACAICAACAASCAGVSVVRTEPPPSGGGLAAGAVAISQRSTEEVYQGVEWVVRAEERESAEEYALPDGMGGGDTAASLRWPGAPSA